MAFIPLPSDLNLAGPDGLKSVNDALRRIADQQAVPAPAPAPAAVVIPPLSDNLAQIAYCSAALTLTAAYADITGATLTLTRSGQYLITACFDFSGSGINDGNRSASGQLVADAVAQANTAQFGPLVISGAGLTGSPQPLRSTVFQQWTYTAAGAGKVVKLQAKKSGGTGASVVDTQTSISAVWLAP